MTLDYFNKYGMLNECLRDTEYSSENCMLFTTVFTLLRKEAKGDYETSLEAFKAYLKLCKIRTGLYNQFPYEVTTGDKWMSHDQLTSIIRMSKEFDLGIHEAIWKEIKRQHFKYDNVHPDTFWTKEGGWHHPMHIMYYGLVCGSKLWYLLYPIVLIMSMITCLSPKESTSGKQICWIKFKGLFPFIHKINTLCVNLKNGSWKNVFSIYYPDPQHPINKEF